MPAVSYDMPAMVATVLISQLPVILGLTLLQVAKASDEGFRALLLRNLAVWFTVSMFYTFVGFLIMYPDLIGSRKYDFLGHWRQLAGDGLVPSANDFQNLYLLDILFQSSFCTFAALLIASSIPRTPYHWLALTFTAVFALVVFPVFGSWVWGSGWLYRIGFRDFAGGTIVFGTALWGSLAFQFLAAREVPPNDEETKKPLTVLWLVAAACLWLAPSLWVHMTTEGGIADFAQVSADVCVLAAGLAAMFFVLVAHRRFSVPALVTGFLAGLAAAASGSDMFNATTAGILGAFAGIASVGATKLLRFYRIADPVGAIAGFGTGALMGALATGAIAIGAGGQALLPQLAGIATNAVWVAGAVWLVLFILFRPVREKEDAAQPR